MKIPEKIKIGGHWYKITYPYHFRERGDLTGFHDGDAEAILVDDRDNFSHEKRPESSVMVTLIHEVLHAIDFVTGHHVFNDNENAIEGFSQCVYQILIDNGYLKNEQVPQR